MGRPCPHRWPLLPAAFCSQSHAWLSPANENSWPWSTAHTQEFAIHEKCQLYENEPCVSALFPTFRVYSWQEFVSHDLLMEEEAVMQETALANHPWASRTFWNIRVFFPLRSHLEREGLGLEQGWSGRLHAWNDNKTRGLHAPSSFFLVYTWNSYRTERNMETLNDEKLFKNTALHDTTWRLTWHSITSHHLQDWNYKASSTEDDNMPAFWHRVCNRDSLQQSTNPSESTPVPRLVTLDFLLFS